MNSPAAAPPNERSLVLLLAFVQFANILDFVMVMPLGPDFARALHIPESQLGFIGGIYMLAAGITGVVVARFLDRFDRRMALTFTLFGLAIGTAAGAFAFNLWSLLAARLFAGAFGGPATSLAMAIISDVVPVQRRGRAMATLMAGFSVASTLGVPAGLWLARIGNWHTPFLGVAALILIAAVIARTVLPSMTGHIGTKRASASTWAMVQRSPVRVALLLAMIQSVAMFVLIPNLSAYFQGNRGYSRDHIETLYLVGGALNFFVISISGRIVDRIGPVAVAWVGAFMMSLACVGGMYGGSPFLPVLAAFIFFMCSGGPRMVPLSTLSSQVPAPHERGQFMSTQSAVQNFSSAAAAMVSALILGTPVVHSEGAAVPAANHVNSLTNMDTLVVVSVVLALAAPFLIAVLARMVRSGGAQGPAIDNGDQDAIAAAH